MSDIAFVNVIGSLNVYFLFNSCLISAYALIIILLYYLNIFFFEGRLGRRPTRGQHIHVLPDSGVKPPHLKESLPVLCRSTSNINAASAAQ